MYLQLQIRGGIHIVFFLLPHESTLWVLITNTSPRHFNRVPKKYDFCTYNKNISIFCMEKVPYLELCYLLLYLAHFLHIFAQKNVSVKDITFLVCIFSVLRLNATYGLLVVEPSLFSVFTVIIRGCCCKIFTKLHYIHTKLNM